VISGPRARGLLYPPTQQENDDEDIPRIRRSTWPFRIASAVVCPLKSGPFESGVFRDNIPSWGGAEDDEGIEVFRRAEGVHSEAGGGRDSGGANMSIALITGLGSSCGRRMGCRSPVWRHVFHGSVTVGWKP